MSAATIDPDEIRERLRLFTWARAQHRLRMAGKGGRSVCFTAAARMISKQCGIDMDQARRVLTGRMVRPETLHLVARWNGLTLRGDALVADYGGNG